jgi:hypothetical protein
VNEKWVQPRFEVVCVNGECTAYAAGVGNDSSDEWAITAVPFAPPAEGETVAEDVSR